jgi:hypothetical protein
MIKSKFKSLLFLYSLTGCDQKEGAPTPFSPEILILYTDTDGNLLERDNATNFEILSVTNSEGDSLEGHLLNSSAEFRRSVGFDMNISELFLSDQSSAERCYTVQYKVTLHSGKERNEELKLAYRKDILGTFTEVWYNGSRMKEASITGVAGFDGTAPVAVMPSRASMAYLYIPVE